MADYIFPPDLNLTKAWKQYTGKIVAFDSEYGAICINQDAKNAYKHAQQQGFKNPLLFNVSLNKLVFPE